MRDAIDQAIGARPIARLDARVAELKASPQGRKLAEWDERFGRILRWVQAAAWAVCAMIAMSAAWLVVSATRGGWAMAAMAIGAMLAALLLWRAWRTLKRPRTVSELVTDELASRLGPARMALQAFARR